MAAATCPRCKSESMDNGVCLFCGPDTPRNRAREPGPLSGAWKGFDRDLGAKKRGERLEAELQVKRVEAARREGTPWSAVVGGIIGVGLLGTLGWMALTGRITPAPTVDTLTGMPSALVKPASAARTDLGLFARELEEFAVEAEHRLTQNPDFTNADIERFLARLTHLHDVGRSLEPQLSREESRVLIGLQHAEKLLRAFINSFLGKAPELDGRRCQAALEQIRRAQALARGEGVDDVVVQFQKKANAAKELEKQLGADR